MSFNQMYNGMGMGMPNYNYTGQAPKITFRNALTDEEIKSLQNDKEQFSLSLTRKEQLRAGCNHRTADGLHDSLVFDDLTGEATCTICGYKFRPVDSDVSLESIQSAVDEVIDVLQTTKLIYVDLPPEAEREYMQIIPLLEKLPNLFKFACKNMSKHESYNWRLSGANMSTMNMFNNLNNILGGGMMGMYQSPAPGYYDPTMANTVAGGYNGAGFGYPNASTVPVPPQPNPALTQQFGGYQPATNGFQYNPNPAAPIPPTAPTAPVDATKDTTTVTQNVTV